MNEAMRADRVRTSMRGLVLSTLMSVLGACSSPAEPEGATKGEGDCQGDACAGSGPAVDWKSASPTYDGHMRVVDSAGDPVKGAVVKAGNTTVMTDEKGNAVLSGLDATVVTAVSVDKPGATPTVTKSSPWKSSRTTQNVVITGLDVDKDVDPKERMTTNVAGAQLDVPGRALATASGARATTAHLSLTFVSGDGSEARLMPGDSSAVDETGRPTAIEKLGGMLYVHFETADGEPLNLAAGQTATLEMPLAVSIVAEEGDTIPLWSLDEVKGEWRKEKTCRVLSRKVGSTTTRVCQGVVDHFSYWAYGREVDIYRPGSLGCMNITARAEAGACFEVSVHSLSTFRCDAKGENCALHDFSRELFLPEPPDVAWCGVMAVGNATYRSVVVYDTDVSGCETGDGEALVGGRRSKTSEALDLASFKETLGSELMLNFTLSGDRDCGTLCAQVPLEITLSDVQGAPWTDRDNDGSYAVSDESLRPVFPVDCNDDRADVRPLAPEPFCVLEDRNCDGKQQKEFAAHTDIDPYSWNRYCGLCKTLEGAKLPLGDETPKNAYDEDCDGLANDMDGDGKSWPEDCNDYDSRVVPGAKEITGNELDEDCDGVALDWDGDGEFNPAHVHLAATLKLPAEAFVDCNDYDPRVKASALLADEAGSLARYYYTNGADTRRSPWFCELFDQSGAPSFRYNRVVRDLNCDGVVTDLDGDGFAAPGDLTLGEGMDIDCDDHDPRVRPLSLEDTACAPPAGLLNDSVCNVPSRRIGEGCPVVTMAGTDVVTVCEETKNPDGTGTGLGACSFPGWWEGNPLVINPGSDWGPCDGEADTAPLPACAAGSSCGGVLPYSEPFSKYLEDTYLEGKPITFQGMCFPSCDLE